MIEPETIQRLYPCTLAEIERAVIVDRYAQFAGNVERTAASLGRSVVTVRYKLRSWGILPDGVPRGPRGQARQTAELALAELRERKTA